MSNKSGCGPTAIRWLIPKSLYHAFPKSCADHDAAYSAKAEGRKVIDKRFLDNMLKEDNNKKALAYTYYGLVRAFGWIYFIRK